VRALATFLAIFWSATFVLAVAPWTPTLAQQTATIVAVVLAGVAAYWFRCSGKERL
jgi:hypothetical protein